MLEKYLRKRIRDYCDTAYPTRLNIVRNDEHRPLLNNRCQHNAGALVQQGKAVAIVECVMISNDEATLHYVNLAPDMTCFDATLGPAWVGGDYRLIEVLREFPGNDPDARLSLMKDKLAHLAGVSRPVRWWYDKGRALS